MTTIRTQAQQYWREQTLPYVEPGVRLLRHSTVEAFDQQMRKLRDDLTIGVQALDACYDELVSAARDQLGQLFDRADYPESLSPHFAIEWDYPSCSPPDYLRSIAPELYEQECQRVQARFDEAVRLAESAFAEELTTLISHLAERLSGQEDGKPKVFRDSAVENLRLFFERFQQLNIRSCAELDSLVEDARRVIGSTEPQDLRETASVRQRVSRELVRVEAALDGFLTDRPRRAIQRRAR